MTNRDFLRALACALLCTAIAATLLAAAYPALHTFPGQGRGLVTAAEGREVRPPWTVEGKDLVARLGTGRATGGNGLRLTGLQQEGNQRAIFTRPVALDAADFPFIEYRIEGRNAATFFYFIWRTAEDPEKVRHIALPGTGDTTAVGLLERYPNWRGDIIEMGIDVYGELRDTAPVVDRLTLLPPSGTNLLRSIWTQWRARTTWTQLSAHHLHPTPTEGVLSPVPATAAWAALSLALALGLARLVRARYLLTGFLALIIPWLSLDLLWQDNLSAQLAETRALFGGKTREEQHLADVDSELYRYAGYLKSAVLPAPGARIFLLHDSERRSYRRLKMQYYLLPHNIFNFGKYPRRAHLQDGDYLLVLDQPRDLYYVKSRQRLVWKDNWLPVEMLDTQAMGSVYRYREAQQ